MICVYRFIKYFLFNFFFKNFKIKFPIISTIIAAIGSHMGDVTHSQDQLATTPILASLSIRKTRKRSIAHPDPEDDELFIFFYFIY